MKSILLAALAFASVSASEFASIDEEDELKLMNLYASASYCSIGLENWACTGKCEQTPNTFFKERIVGWTHSNVLIVYNNVSNSIIASFKGTDPQSKREIVVDFLMMQKKLKGTEKRQHIKVHYGFQYSFRRIRERFREAIASLIKEYPGASLKFTGHSAGGAFAVLAALDLAEDYGADRISVYTYGEPRMGNVDFVRIHRVTYGSDVVTYFPARHFLGFERWMHHSREWFIDPKTNKTMKCEYREEGFEDPDCSISLMKPSYALATGFMRAYSALKSPFVKHDLSYHYGYFGQELGCGIDDEEMGRKLRRMKRKKNLGKIQN